MVLAALLTLATEEPEVFTKYDVTFLSVGTDGIDGPTDAAGAVVDQAVGSESRTESLAGMRRALEENDSYNFFSGFNGGRQLIKTGHTGTNVMDLHLLAITPKGHSFKAT